MIYYAQIDATGGIKIGYSDDVPARLVQLEKHYGCPVALLATEPGGKEKEAKIHELFAGARLGRTEQFRPTEELMRFIGKPLLAHANPDAVEARNLKAIDIETGLVRKMKKIAQDKGIDLSEYVMTILRPRVERDWIEVLKTFVENMEDEE